MAAEKERSLHGNGPLGILPSNSGRNVLALNVLLLGNTQSGRSSVGNALIGSEEFPVSVSVSGVAVTTEMKLVSRNFPGFFRRKGAESDLTLGVIDTPPFMPRPLRVRELCPAGVHVVVLVVRGDLLPGNAQLEECVESLFGPEWRRHALVVITHADRLKGAGLRSAACLATASDWLRALAHGVEGGVAFVDNSCDWLAVRGGPLREKLLQISARNHHSTLKWKYNQ